MTTHTLTTISQQQIQSELSSRLQQLTDSQAVAIAITLLFDALQPIEVNLDFSTFDSTGPWDNCIQLTNQLSSEGKVGLAAEITQSVATRRNRER